MDIIASEYGWKVNYILHELPYRRFKKLFDAIGERKSDKLERELTNQMYSTYLMTETMRQVNDREGKYKPIKFKKYLKTIGLGELARKRLKVNHTDKETAIKKANNNVVDAVKAFSEGGE